MDVRTVPPGTTRTILAAAIRSRRRADDRAHRDGIGSVAWVVAQNLKRRHLDKGQAAACAAEAEPLLAAEARERGHRGKEGGRGRKKNPSRKNAGRGSRHGRKSSAAAGQAFGVGGRYVQQAKALKARAPEVFEAVKAGKVRLSVAKEIAALDGEARKEALKAALAAGKSGALKAVRAIRQRERARRLAGVGCPGRDADTLVSAGRPVVGGLGLPVDPQEPRPARLPLPHEPHDPPGPHSEAVAASCSNSRSATRITRRTLACCALDTIGMSGAASLSAVWVLVNNQQAWSWEGRKPAAGEEPRACIGLVCLRIRFVITEGGDK